MIDQDNAMASCHQVEIKISEVREMLLIPRPETLDACEGELRGIVAALETLVSSDPANWSPAMRESLPRIQKANRTLGLQIAHASNLCLGRIQWICGTGYTRQGEPLFANREAGTSFEA